MNCRRGDVVLVLFPACGRRSGRPALVANNAGTQAGEAELAALHKSAAAGKELLGVVAPELVCPVPREFLGLL